MVFRHSLFGPVPLLGSELNRPFPYSLQAPGSHRSRRVTSRPKALKQEIALEKKGYDSTMMTRVKTAS